MTPQDVADRLAAIRKEAGDNEQQHGLEDELYVAVLRSIAEGSCEDPAETARVALQANDIEFTRWYA